MVSRAYIRIEPQEGAEPDGLGMVPYFLDIFLEGGSDPGPEEIEFMAPAGLVAGGEFPFPPRAMMWVAWGICDQADVVVEAALNPLLARGKVLLEAGLPNDESQSRGKRVVWRSSDSLDVVGADCEKRDVQWRLEQAPIPPAPARPRSRL